MRKKINLSATAHGAVVLAVATLSAHHGRVVVLAVLTHGSVILAILTVLTRSIVLAITTSVGHFIYS